MMRTRNLEASRRFSERREREDHAPRLRDECPELEVLDLALSERRADAETSDTTHTRRIVIAGPRRPLLPEQLLGHELSRRRGTSTPRQIMQPLLERAQRRFEGEHTCLGNVGNRTCGRILHFVATAEVSHSVRNI